MYVCMYVCNVLFCSVLFCSVLFCYVIHINGHVRTHLCRVVLMSFGAFYCLRDLICLLRFRMCTVMLEGFLYKTMEVQCFGDQLGAIGVGRDLHVYVYIYICIASIWLRSTVLYEDIADNPKYELKWSLFEHLIWPYDVLIFVKNVICWYRSAQFFMEIPILILARQISGRFFPKTSKHRFSKVVMLICSWG